MRKRKIFFKNSTGSNPVNEFKTIYIIYFLMYNIIVISGILLLNLFRNKQSK